MDVPATVLAIVLAETAVGGIALLWLLPTYGNVRHGYEVLLGSTLTLMALGAWAALRTPLDTVIISANSSQASIDAAIWTGRGLLALTILAGVATIAPLVKAPLAGRVVGFASLAVGLATFVPLAQLRVERAGAGGLTQGVLELVMGAFFMGAIWDGMILGHWYLVERKLSNKYMVYMAWANVGAVVAGIVGVVLSSRNPVPCLGLTGVELQTCALSFSPILSIGSVTIMIGIGVIALIALIAGFNIKLANEGGRSIQASTGMFYLAVILAPAAEFAAKIRFF